VTDADWHGVYDRSQAIGNTAPVWIGDNVWIGDSAIICKGVRVGENSIIGAGSVVVKEIPDNVIAGGNPASVLKSLEKGRAVRTRAEWLADPKTLADQFEAIDRHLMRNNTWLDWIRSLVRPRKAD
jgi:serine acetyltransferase